MNCTANSFDVMMNSSDVLFYWNIVSGRSRQYIATHDYASLDYCTKVFSCIWLDWNARARVTKIQGSYKKQLQKSKGVKKRLNFTWEKNFCNVTLLYIHHSNNKRYTILSWQFCCQGWSSCPARRVQNCHY